MNSFFIKFQTSIGSHTSINHGKPEQRVVKWFRDTYKTDFEMYMKGLRYDETETIPKYWGGISGFIKFHAT